MVTLDFKTQYGLILGGSSGLGFASAQKLAAHGMTLIIVYRASRMMEPAISNAFKTLENTNSHLYINADATQAAKQQEIVQSISTFLKGAKLAVLLHSIAKGNVKTMTGDNPLQIGDYDQTIQSMGTSLYSWFCLLQTTSLLTTNARIVAFTSEGSTRPMPGYAAVSAAKATLEAIIRNIAIEYGATGITANCIQAGVTDTDSLRRIPNAQQIIDTSLQRNPTGRLTTPQDIANAVYLLCRPEAAFINGTILRVDGGEHLS